MIPNNLIPPEQQQHVDELITKYVLLGMEISTQELMAERDMIHREIQKYLGAHTGNVIMQCRKAMMILGAYTPPIGFHVP